MYLCVNCGEMFDCPESARDFDSEYFGRSVTHYTDVCPQCGSDDIEEMDRCEICGEYIKQGEDLCEWCRELVKDLAYEIRNKVREKSIVHKLKYNEFLEHLTEEL